MDGSKYRKLHPALCLIWCSAALVAAQTVTVEYTFERPTVTSVLVGTEQFDRVTMPGAPNGGMVGQPALPSRGASILLPYGTALRSVTIDAGERVRVGEGFVIEPVPEPVPLPLLTSESRPPVLDQTVYGTADPFPAVRSAQIGVQSLRGFEILVLRLWPAEYVPATGELYYYPRLTVTIETEVTGATPALYRGFPADRERAARRVDNPAFLDSYPAQQRAARSYSMLILTTPALVSSFEPLKAYHDAHGVLTEIHTTDEVGGTNPDLVRAYITERYLNDGIEYVLIGGDDDVIPAKDLYVDSLAGYTETAMPGDLYFSCLDGTWNNDGDSRWGEPNDGPGGGDVDLYGDVDVGRAAVGNATEAARFVNKTIWYWTGQHTQPDKVLLVGEYLGFGGESEYATAAMNELINGSSAHGYTTVGIPSDEYTIDTLYDAPGYDWPASQLISRINAGRLVVNHLGHGDIEYAMKLYNSDVLGDLTNTDLCFVYSQTCLAGHFDGAECWAETAHIKTDHAAFAVIMNARYGWGEYNSTDGASQRFNREFWDAVFNPEEGYRGLAAANQDSKEDNVYRIGDAAMRWCYYELNLFGDPTMPADGNTTPPHGISIKPYGGYAAQGNAGGPYLPASMDYFVENKGQFEITYEVTKSVNWVTITNGTGTIPVGGSATVTVAINGYANALPVGQHTGLLTFTNLTDHDGDTTRPVTLTMGVAMPVHGAYLDSDPGWTVSGGQWAFGQPTGQGGGLYGNPDPTSGATGPYVYGVNLNGNYSTQIGGPYYVTTSAFDLSNATQVSLRFKRWLNTDYLPYVSAKIEASTDGTTWTQVWSNSNVSIRDNAWTEYQYSLSPLADHQPTVYLRWSYAILKGGAYAYSGWNIDDVEIWALTPAPSHPAGDMNCDDVVDFGDINPFVLVLTNPDQYVADYPTCNYLLADISGNGGVGFEDINPFVALLAGGTN